MDDLVRVHADLRGAVTRLVAGHDVAGRDTVFDPVDQRLEHGVEIDQRCAGGTAAVQRPIPVAVNTPNAMARSFMRATRADAHRWNERRSLQGIPRIAIPQVVGGPPMLWLSAVVAPFT